MDVTPTSYAPSCKTVDHVFPLRHVRSLPQPYRKSIFPECLRLCSDLFLRIEPAFLIHACSAIKLLTSVTAGTRLNGSDLAHQPQQITNVTFQSFAASSLACSFHAHCREACQPKQEDHLAVWFGHIASSLPLPARAIPRFSVTERPGKTLHCMRPLRYCLFLAPLISLGPYLRLFQGSCAANYRAAIVQVPRFASSPSLPIGYCSPRRHRRQPSRVLSRLMQASMHASQLSYSLSHALPRAHAALPRGTCKNDLSSNFRGGFCSNFDCAYYRKAQHHGLTRGGYWIFPWINWDRPQPILLSLWQSVSKRFSIQRCTT